MRGSHVHCVSIDGLGAQLCPCGIVTTTPWTFTVTSQPDQYTRPESSPTTFDEVRTAHQPRSTGFELATTQEALQRRFLTYTVPSRSPGPTDPAVLDRPDFVAAAPTLPGVSRIRLPPASPTCHDRPAVESSHLHSKLQRLVAHYCRCYSSRRTQLPPIELARRTEILGAMASKLVRR